jgi:DNA-binding transcriptional LysR family regulator
MAESSSVLLHRLLARGKFRHVQVLLRLAELGSVQHAADAIGVTQSSVTQTLAYLEDLLGTPLFQRHARGVRPTAACRELVPIARQIVARLAEAVDTVSARRRQGSGTVRLLASASATNGLLIRALPAFHQQHPGIEVHLREAEGEDQLLAIARGEADLVACRRPPALPQGWEFHVLLEDRFAVVCSPHHALCHRRSITFAALADQTWLAAPAGTAAREQFDRATAAWPSLPRLHPLVTRLLEPLLTLIQGSDCLYLLPLSFVRHLVDSGTLAVLPVKEAMPMEPIGLLQPDSEMREAAQTLAQFLRSTETGSAAPNKVLANRKLRPVRGSATMPG